MIRVLIVDDQALVREGFCMILAAEADIDVVGEAGDGVQALQLARELAPDVVLMDIRMPRLDGLEAARRLLARDGEPPHVVMLTTFNQDEYIYDALRAGASGFRSRTSPEASCCTRFAPLSPARRCSHPRSPAASSSASPRTLPAAQECRQS